MILPASLVEELKQRQAVLFVGSGLSATLGLPNWSGLIGKMADDLGYDPEIFTLLGSYPSLAEYYLIKKPGRSVLAKWLKQEWHSALVDISVSQAHRALVAAHFPIIYTTNYDHWIEKAHKLFGKPAIKIVHGDEFAGLSAGGTPIVKFHGDLDFPNSMVLTEADYFERLRFESELDIILRSDLLKYSIIFIGYSLQDINMRNMLYRLSLYRREHMVRCKNLRRSYIFLDRRNEVQATIFERWGIDAIVSERLNLAEGLNEFMCAVAEACR
jgi:hypothetical protein